MAQQAGVSASTVSRVLNGHARVDPILAARVRQAIAALNYQPSAAARTLRTQQNHVWSLIVPDIRHSFAIELLPGIEHEAHKAGYALIVSNADQDPDREVSYIHLAIAQQVAGVILVPLDRSPRGLWEIEDHGIPVVAVDQRPERATVDAVLLDNVSAARDAVDHLVQGGSRRIACIAGLAGTTTGDERLQGYREGLEQQGIPYDPSLVREGGFDVGHGREAAEALLRLASPPEALLVTNNEMTIGALQALGSAGTRIPADIAIVGFGDARWTELLQPPLTTVSQPTSRLGQTAAQLLLSRLQGYEGPPREVVLPATLMVRASSVRTARPAE